MAETRRCEPVVDLIVDTSVRGRLSETERRRIRSRFTRMVRAAWLAEWAPLLESNAQPLNTYRVISAIDQTIDREHSIVTHDAGAPRDSIVPFYTATTPHSSRSRTSARSTRTCSSASRSVSRCRGS